MESNVTANERSDRAEQSEQASGLWPHYQDEGYAYERPRRGDLLTGTVVQVRERALWVDVGVKRDGLVTARDLNQLDEEPTEAFAVGDEVPVFVVRPWNREGELILSVVRGRELEDWERAEEMLESGEIVDLDIDRYNKGGALVSFGAVQGFVPASHLEPLPRGLSQEERREALAALIGETLPLKVIEVNRSRRRLVLSNRKAERERREQRKEELLETLKVGDVVTGKVVAMRKFGAFVDIGGADGLVHISEISTERIDHPSDALEEGEQVEVYVLRLDKERKRIGLSIKRLLPDPWEGIQTRYYPTQLVEATITHLVPYGSFARLEPGVEGLIHISKLSHEHVEHPRDVVSVGDAVTLRIINVDPVRRRISLSLKDAPQWVEAPATEQEEQEEGQAEGESTPERMEPQVVAEQQELQRPTLGEVASLTIEEPEGNGGDKEQAEELIEASELLEEGNVS